MNSDNQISEAIKILMEYEKQGDSRLIKKLVEKYDKEARRYNLGGGKDKALGEWLSKSRPSQYERMIATGGAAPIPDDVKRAENLLRTIKDQVDIALARL